MNQTMIKEISQKLSNVVDGQGKPIDSQIFNLVVILNALNFDTTQSCEGHMDWGTAGPWIEFSPKLDSSLKQKMQTILEQRNKDPENKELSIKYLEFEADFLKPVKEQGKNLLKLISDFYSYNLNNNIDSRIHIIFKGSTLKIENQGLFLQDIRPLEVRKNKLEEYQLEFKKLENYLLKSQ